MGNWLAPLISFLLAAALAVGCTWMGYWMGRNSAGQPVRNMHNTKPAEPDPDVVIAGDVFDTAMAEDDTDRRIATIR